MNKTELNLLIKQLTRIADELKKSNELKLNSIKLEKKRLLEIKSNNK